MFKPGVSVNGSAGLWAKWLTSYARRFRPLVREAVLLEVLAEEGGYLPAVEVDPGFFAARVVAAG